MIAQGHILLPVPSVAVDTAVGSSSPPGATDLDALQAALDELFTTQLQQQAIRQQQQASCVLFTLQLQQQQVVPRGRQSTRTLVFCIPGIGPGVAPRNDLRSP